MGKFQSTKVFDGFSTVSVNGEQMVHTAKNYTVTEYLLNYGLKEN